MKIRNEEHELNWQVEIYGGRSWAFFSNGLMGIFWSTVRDEYSQALNQKCQ
jgi:hypothetical protein